MKHKLKIFVVYSLLNDAPLTPDTVFSTLALTTLLYQPLLTLPTLAKYLVEALSSTTRIEHFLSLKEFNQHPMVCNSEDGFVNEKFEMNDGKRTNSTSLYTTDVSAMQSIDSYVLGHLVQDHISLEIKNGFFSWENNQAADLVNINIKFRTGTLTMIIGSIGSGKSSIISALLGEMYTISGTVLSAKYSRMAYAAQKPWLQNASIKDNIVFGERFNSNRYNAVVGACALNDDLHNLPGGDMTEIGENGINLSGGQKQRISVARALYSMSDIVLLDDPLSALDAHVGEHVMEKAIFDFLRKEDRTVILVTHQIQHLEYADEIVFMENGKISHKGNLAEIRETNKELYRQWEMMVSTISDSEGDNDNNCGLETTQKCVSKESLQKLTKKEGTTLISEEKRNIGTISRDVIFSYARAIKLPLVGVLLILFLLQIAANVASNLWLSTWSHSEQESANTTVKIWMSLNGLLALFVQLATVILVNAIISPYFILLMIPIALVTAVSIDYGVGLPRDLKRMDSITLSPVLAQFTETFVGLPTIRAYRAEKRFQKCMLNKLDKNTLCQLYYARSLQWIGWRFSIIGMFLVLVIGMGALLISVYGNFKPSEMGLSITIGLIGSQFLGALMPYMVDITSYVNGVERVVQYTHLATENYQGFITPPGNWPYNGTISITNMSARYSDCSLAVLKNVNVRIPAHAKVGICGRTGCGKSSLTLALLRMIDVFKGRITIDGIDIAEVPLLTLRSRLSIIPQDPVLFCGTIRFNLDPDNKYSSVDLWNALEIAQLKECVRTMDGQLDAMVTEGGDNFSTGQIQLFCLARAFLRESKILIMDEATSSVDYKTDVILQNVISEAFADKTVLTIAHRVTTILNSDIVLVLSDGKLLEYDTPSNLLAKNDSMFASLVNKTTNI
ncbi:ATP-binding cassette sub-family C member 9-like [Saccoglossus kowalevskii]